METNYLNKISIDNAIDMAINKIELNQRIVGDEEGWHQHLGAKKIGVVASAMGVKLFCKLRQYSVDNYLNVLDTIIQKQHVDGGWGYISNSSRISNIDATCWALLALNLAKENYIEVINKGTKWLLSQINEIPNQNEAWGFIKGDQSRTYITVTAIYTLYSLDPCLQKREEVQTAIMWLISSQNRNDGGWGEIQGSYSTLFHTSHVLCILSLLKIKQLTCEKIKRGLGFIRNKLTSYEKLLAYSSIGSCEYIDVVEENKSSSRVHIYHFTIPYLINAFISTKNENDEIVFWGIKYLVSSCKDGVWQHPYLEETSIKPIWSIYNSVDALLNFRNQYKDWGNIDYIKLTQKKGIKTRKGKYRLGIHIFFEKYSRKIKYAIFFFSILLLLIIFPFIKDQIYLFLKEITFPIWIVDLYKEHKEAFHSVVNALVNIGCSIIATVIYVFFSKKIR